MKVMILYCALTAAATGPVVGQLEQYQDLDQTTLSTSDDPPYDRQSLFMGGTTASTQGPVTLTGPGWLFTGGSTASTAGKNSAPPVIVQLSPTSSEALAAMSEDLAIMTRVIERGLDGKLGKEEKPTKMSVQLQLTGSGRSVRAMYIEGLGALFMIKVNFGLVPPPKVEKTSAPATDSEWEQARSEIRGTAAPDDWVGSSRVDDRGEFKEDQVEALKAALFTALKQASNIRHLKADDVITVCVFGTGGATLQKTVAVQDAISAYQGTFVHSAIVGREAAPVESNGKYTITPTVPAAPAGRQSRSAAPQYGNVAGDRAVTVSPALPVTIRTRDGGRETVLTIRVKKAEVDSFAKGEVDLKTFQTRATINAYAGAGHDVPSVNTWLRR